MSTPAKNTPSPPPSVRLRLYFHRAEWSLRELFLLLAALPNERERAGVIRHVLTFGCKSPLSPDPAHRNQEVVALSVRVTLSAKDPWLLPLLQEVNRIDTPAGRCTFVKQRLFKIYSSANQEPAFSEAAENTAEKITPLQDTAPELSQHQKMQSQQQELAPAPIATPSALSDVPEVARTLVDQGTAASLAEIPRPETKENPGTNPLHKNPPATPSVPHQPLESASDAGQAQSETTIVTRKSASFREKMRMSANMLKQQN